MITITPEVNAWKKTRASMHKLRDVEFALNKNGVDKATLHPVVQTKQAKVRRPTTKKATRSKSKKANDKMDRTSFEELVLEGMVDKAAMEIRKAVTRSNPKDEPASQQAVDKATMEVKNAIIRCKQS